ncbi:glutamate receptor ionotropic, kainate 2-like isoform X2 [Culicoides brevitarsis]|uniref:glutamate receptor ionotropic, kainate 2-like isoform X2 n=1 Tax=Culicoides brevitarsis TaxID=469753 RepID=UPI00307C19A0
MSNDRSESMRKKCILIVLIAFSLFYEVNGGRKREIPIGAIFPPIYTQSEIAFRAAIKRANLHTNEVEFIPSIKHVSDLDSFKAEMAACELLEEGVAAIFGPASNITSDLIRLKDVLGLHGPKDPPCTIVELDQGTDYRPALKKIYYSTEPHIIISVETHKIAEILNQARDVRMLDEYKSYIIISLDAHTIDLTKEVGEITSNITALRLLDPTSDEVDNAASFMRNEEKNLGRITYLTKEEYMKQMQTESVMYYDAVQLFAQAFEDMNSVNDIQVESFSCKEKSAGWNDGYGIAKYMKRKEVTGISGPLTIDENGHRRDFLLEVIEFFQKKNAPLSYSENGFKKIGTWDALNKITYTRTEGEIKEQLTESFQNKTFIVASRIGAPFLSYRKAENGEILEGNARFEGYSLDLFEGISKVLGFTYRFELVPDGKYGSYNPKTKKWDGLVKHLLDRKADFAICDLTITQQRRKAVDFTMPFMTLGISILYKKPKKEEKELFSFLSPLSNDVWICTAAAYLGVSLLTFVLARMADAEWEDPHPCKRQSEEKENIWNLLNCTWLTMGSVMGQGSDILPKGNSTRLVTGMWYFFALIMLASYTANLAAFLTMDRMEATIESAEDLAKQTKIKYGVLEGGSSAAFFRDSNVSLYKRMWAAMESSSPSVFTKSNDEGRDRVLNPKSHYAFFMESTTLEYMTERNCNLTQIGGLLDSKGYGIAMPRDSPYRKAITGAILKMSEEGKLHKLKTRWWKEKGVKGSCATDSTASAGGAAELDIASVGGVFLLVGLGICMGVIIAFFEFIWNVRKIAVEEKMSQWEAFKRELKFALKVNVTSKPVRRSTSEISSYTRSKRSRSSSIEL